MSELRACSVCYGSGFDMHGSPCPCRCKPNDLRDELTKLREERDALAAVVSQVVECIGRLPHEPHGLVIDDLCRIVAPDPTAILAARDARVRSEARAEEREACAVEVETSSQDMSRSEYADAIRAMKD